MTGHDWKTVAKKIKEIDKEKNILPRSPTQGIRSLPRTDYEMVRSRPIRVRMHKKLREEGVKAGYSSVEEYIAQIKKSANKFIHMH